MSEYGGFASRSAMSFSDLLWEMQNLWQAIPWGMELVIVLLVVFLVFMLLNTRK